MITFEQKVKDLRQHHEDLLVRKNVTVSNTNAALGSFRFSTNGIYEKYRYPVLTA